MVYCEFNLLAVIFDKRNPQDGKKETWTIEAKAGTVIDDDLNNLIKIRKAVGIRVNSLVFYVTGAQC